MKLAACLVVSVFLLPPVVAAQEDVHVQVDAARLVLSVNHPVSALRALEALCQGTGARCELPPGLASVRLPAPLSWQGGWERVVGQVLEGTTWNFVAVPAASGPAQLVVMAASGASWTPPAAPALPPLYANATAPAPDPAAAVADVAETVSDVSEEEGRRRPLTNPYQPDPSLLPPEPDPEPVPTPVASSPTAQPSAAPAPVVAPLALPEPASPVAPVAPAASPIRPPMHPSQAGPPIRIPPPPPPPPPPVYVAVPSSKAS